MSPSFSQPLCFLSLAWCACRLELIGIVPPDEQGLRLAVEHDLEFVEGLNALCEQGTHPGSWYRETLLDALAMHFVGVPWPCAVDGERYGAVFFSVFRARAAASGWLLARNLPVG